MLFQNDVIKSGQWRTCIRQWTLQLSDVQNSAVIVSQDIYKTFQKTLIVIYCVVFFFAITYAIMKITLNKQFK